LGLKLEPCFHLILHSPEVSIKTGDLNEKNSVL